VIQRRAGLGALRGVEVTGVVVECLRFQGPGEDRPERVRVTVVGDSAEAVRLLHDAAEAIVIGTITGRRRVFVGPREE
jgi:hypothetical protein